MTTSPAMGSSSLVNARAESTVSVTAEEWDSGLFDFEDPNEDDDALIYPLGKKPWEELILITDVHGINPVNAIMPITSDKEKDAYIIQRKNNSYVLVRLSNINSSTYNDLKEGSTALVEFEWASLKHQKEAPIIGK